LLRVTDLVKFAKHRPEESKHKEVLDEAKALIRRMDTILLDPVANQNQEEEE